MVDPYLMALANHINLMRNRPKCVGGLNRLWGMWIFRIPRRRKRARVRDKTRTARHGRGKGSKKR